MAPIISKKDTAPLRQYASVKSWVKGKSARTQYTYLRILARLTFQVEEDPDSLIRLVRPQNLRVLKELIDEFPVESQSVLRGFFRANGCSWTEIRE